MISAHAHELPADDPRALAEAVELAAGGAVVYLVRDGQPVADVVPHDPDAEFVDMLADLDARLARQQAQTPNPNERLARWLASADRPTVEQHAEFLRRTGLVPDHEADVVARAAAAWVDSLPGQ